MDQNTNNDQNDQLESLETPETISPTPEASPAEQPKVISAEQPTVQAPASLATEQQKTSRFKNKFSGMRQSLNIYLLFLALLMLLALIIGVVAYQKSRQSGSRSNQTDSSSQELNDDVLNQLRNTDVKLGDPQQILTVEANAVFGGSVLIRGDFEVAGQIRSSGPLNISAINVGGPGTFQSLQAGDLQLNGNGQIQGNLAVQNSLSVSGSGNFGGTLSAAKLSIQSLELAGDLVISRHINASGGTPGSSNGNALGGGGTSSLSGTDTAGTINVNTGGGPSPGCFINVSFAQKFNSTPHVVITPVGSGGSGVNYYVNRSSTGFSVCTSSSAPANQSFSFDYIVIN